MTDAGSSRCPTCNGRWVGDPEGSGEPCADPFHANNPRYAQNTASMSEELWGVVEDTLRDGMPPNYATALRVIEGLRSRMEQLEHQRAEAVRLKLIERGEHKGIEQECNDRIDTLTDELAEAKMTLREVYGYLATHGGTPCPLTEFKARRMVGDNEKP
jgi:hypothetical protein